MRPKFPQIYSGNEFNCVTPNKKEDTSTIEKTVENSNGKLALYKFGQTYLRVFAEYVYLPAERGATNSVSISVSTLNKTPLTFKTIVESQPKEV